MTGTPATPDFTDTELIDYIEAHARTELGLVSALHLARLYRLAGADVPSELLFRKFWSVSPSSAEPLVTAARACLAARARLTEEQKTQALDVIFHVDKGCARSLLTAPSAVVDKPFTSELLDVMIACGFLREHDGFIKVSSGGWTFWRERPDPRA